MDIEPIPMEDDSGRQVLAKLAEYHGDPAEYEYWRAILVAKVRVDGHRMGGPVGIVAAIMMACKGKAATLAGPFLQQEIAVPNPSFENTLAYLDRLFKDRELQRRAHDQWTRLRQGKTPFPVYYADFERLLLQAGGSSWQEEIKTQGLRAGVSPELMRAMVGRELPDTLYALATVYHRAWEDLERIRAPSTIYHNHFAPVTPDNYHQPMDVDVPGSFAVRPGRSRDRPPIAGDDELKGKRARWISKEEFDRRRRANACTRCGRLQCASYHCPLLPAIRPNQKPVASVSYIAPSLSDVIDGDDTGKANA